MFGFVRSLRRRWLSRRALPASFLPLSAYGATNEAEFFAVATEAFFEKPVRLKEKAPELYEQLRRYYQLDPIRNQ